MRSAATIKTRIVYCCQFLGKRYVSRNQLYRNAICAEDLRSKNRGQQRQTIHTINITVKRGKARTKRERETRIYGGRWITNEITNEITMSTGRRTKGHAKCIRGGTRKYGVMLVKRRREGEEREERERESVAVQRRVIQALLHEQHEDFPPHKETWICTCGSREQVCSRAQPTAYVASVYRVAVF